MFCTFKECTKKVMTYELLNKALCRRGCADPRRHKERCCGAVVAPASPAVCGSGAAPRAAAPPQRGTPRSACGSLIPSGCDSTLVTGGTCAITCVRKLEMGVKLGGGGRKIEISDCPFIFVYSERLIGVFELQLPRRVPSRGRWGAAGGAARCLRSPARGSGQSHSPARPFLCLTYDLWKQELIKSSKVAKRKGKCLVTN